MGIMQREIESLLTVEQVAKKLQMPVRSVRALVASRGIPVIKISARRKRFNWGDVQDALAKVTVKSV